MNHNKLGMLIAIACTFALAACAQKTEAPAAAAPAAVETAPAPIPAPDPAILAAATRPTQDAADDAARKPLEVLAFSRIAPGATVIDMEAGGGYFTELIASVVGTTGKVYMQNPPEFKKFAGDAITARLADNRLANVTYMETYFDNLTAADASVDVVTWFLGPHDLYYKPEGSSKGLGDAVKSYSEIFRVLKPSGYFVVLDHAAAAGSPTDTGGTIHRIDPAHVKASAAAAGFALEEESSLLANPADDHKLGVFDPKIRRKTDQFLLRFIKPGTGG
jgi:predicted methyltransferase